MCVEFKIVLSCQTRNQKTIVFCFAAFTTYYCEVDFWWHLTFCVFQKKNRSVLYDEFKKQMATLLGQWEHDIERVKESEEKLNVSRLSQLYSKPLRASYWACLFVYNVVVWRLRWCFNESCRNRVLTSKGRISLPTLHGLWVRYCFILGLWVSRLPCSCWLPFVVSYLVHMKLRQGL